MKQRGMSWPTAAATMAILGCLCPGVAVRAGLAEDYLRRAQWGYADAQNRLGACYAEGAGVPVDAGLAAQWFRRAAEQGHAEGQCNLGACYAEGKGVPAQDWTAAATWYRKSAEQGFGPAQNNLGECLESGRGVPRDAASAATWYRKAADGGLAAGQYNLGRCHDGGRGVAQDSSEAVKWYRKAAAQKHAPAQCALGVCYSEGRGVKVDRVEAAKCWQAAANQGHPRAQCFLGEAYAAGDGVRLDAEVAAKWYRKSAEQGDVRAQVNLGRCYERGEGVGRDSSKSMVWYRKAAEQGDARAQYMVGASCDRGEDCPRDRTAAATWYRKAAEQGFPAAQCALGDLEAAAGRHGLAASWYRKAAEQGNVSAQYKFGACCAAGRGVPANSAEAGKWWRLAAEQGHEVAQREMGLRDLRDGGNLTRAVGWLTAAARRKDAEAQFSLGECYEHGRGVQRDLNKAIMCYRRAAENGHQEAHRRLVEAELKWAGYEAWKEEKSFWDDMPEKAQELSFVEPRRGSILRCRLNGPMGIDVDHSGIYVGNGYIIHRDGDGYLDRVTPGEFLARLNGDNEASAIYVACTADGRPIGGEEIAQRAELALADRSGEHEGYSLLLKNCHIFSQYCSLGTVDKSWLDVDGGGSALFTMFEGEIRDKWGSCVWHSWKDLPRWRRNGKFVK